MFWFILAATFLACDYIHFYAAIFNLLLQLFGYFYIDIHSITLPFRLNLYTSYGIDYGNAGGEPRESAPPGLARTPTPSEPRMEPPIVSRGPYGPCTSSSQIPPCLSVQPRPIGPAYLPRRSPGLFPNEGTGRAWPRSPLTRFFLTGPVTR